MNKYAKAPAQQPVHPPPSVGDGCGCPRPRLGQVAHGCGFIEHLAFALGSCRLGWPPLGWGGAGGPRKVWDRTRNKMICACDGAAGALGSGAGPVWAARWPDFPSWPRERGLPRLGIVEGHGRTVLFMPGLTAARVTSQHRSSVWSPPPTELPWPLTMLAPLPTSRPGQLRGLRTGIPISPSGRQGVARVVS